MRSVSETIAAVAPSATMAMSNRSKEMIASGIDVISLAVGEPDFATPAHITQAAIDALNRGETHYAPSRGLPELTQAVAEKLNRDNHIAATQKQIMVLGRSSLRLIADVCTDHDLFCLSDEIYEKLVYGKEHVSIATIGDMLDRTITINGFSKAYAMTGWRLGYLAAPLDVIPAMDKVMQHSVGCVNTFAMWGGVAALTGDQTCVEEMRKQFEQRRSFVIGRLAGMGLSTAPAEGAFYAFINVGGDDVATANKWLDKAHVAATPGTAFGAPGWIRISYAASMERLAEALDRIEAVQ